MDVTSLLNANSVAAEQQRKMEKGETSKTPTRNRTPWDAGGYSLPINTISNSNSTPTTPPKLQNSHDLHHDDSQAGAIVSPPTSPRHKFSDSRSSLSSFTSSLQSTTHSRFSSMSTTVSSTHPLNSYLETLSPTSSLKIQEMDLNHLHMESAQQPASSTQPRGSLSPTGSLDALARVAENQIATQQQVASSTLEDQTSTTPERTPNANATSITERPTSPSDAILIKRATLPSLRLVTGGHELNGTSPAHIQDNFLSAPLETHHQSLLHSRSHKRALSAPDFTASRSTLPTMADSMAMRPSGEPTPPSSHHPDNPSPTATTAAYPNPDTPPTMADTESNAVVCMYIPNCDTGSQPRKAISHIFGRNKMCTRLIPQHVWVHYCRKHYQRSRYRNPKEYAKLQCDLVQQQIRRVHEWSLNNAKNGVAGVVQDWGLAVRKREQKRLDDLGGSRKRNAAVFEQDSDEGEDGNGRAVPVPATAVPDWLLALCGKGYNTQAILEIFNRLHTEILEDTLPCFPDIEILPNINVDSDEPKSPRGYAKRPTQGHKRAQSLGVGKSNYYTQDRRNSQPVIYGQESVSYDSPIGKRRRAGDVMDTGSPLRITQGSRYAERPLEPGRRMQAGAHRPAFEDINEHQAGDVQYYQGYTPPRYQAPLPAPTPQRHNGQSMAAHLEVNNEHAASRRPIHNRSRSEFSGIGGGLYQYSPAPASVYSQGHGYQSQSRPAQFQESPQPHSTHYSPQHSRWESMPQYQAMRHTTQLPGLGHHRAQSTSMVPSAYSSPMPSVHEHPPQAAMSPYTQGTLPIGPHITESPEARVVYACRQ